MEEAKASLSQSAYRKWQQYWAFEPWGPMRDNLHAAIIAGEIRAGRLKKGSTVSLSQFMIVDRGTRRRENRAGFVALLRMVGRSRADVKKAKAKAKGKNRKARR